MKPYRQILFILAGLFYAALNFFLIFKLIFLVDQAVLRNYYVPGSCFELSLLLAEAVIHIGIIGFFLIVNVLGVALYQRIVEGKEIKSPISRHLPR